jgi:hypothetical protein
VLHCCSVDLVVLKVRLSPGSDRIADHSADPDCANCGLKSEEPYSRSPSRGITVAARVRLGFSAPVFASALDLGDGAAQFGGERAESVAAALAVTGLAGLLQSVGGGTEPGGTDRPRGALEPVRGGC